jgi:glyoxylase-like metal-dependent hydrolase (beta-lactamase superfamily II)
MRELSPGLWHWQAEHPGWEETEPWDKSVSSYAIDDGERLLLFDPLEPPDEIVGLIGDRETAIVLTAPWHERSSESLVERFGVPVYTPRPDTAQELMDTWGITAEQAGDGSPDVVWLLKEGKGEAHVYTEGDALPDGIHAFQGQKKNDMVLWVESHNAVVVGDTLPDFGEGLHINPRWLVLPQEQVLESLRPLLDLPVEHVLATHGGPFEKADLERALA